MPNNITILYFASLAEAAGIDEEVIQTTSDKLEDIYKYLKIKHDFMLDQSQLAVAINHQISDWQSPVTSGDVIAFIPPVAGG